MAYLEKTLRDGWHTLETGSGLSSLIFASKGCCHTCVTPFQSESDRIVGYCREQGIPIERLSFQIGFSHYVLPRLADDGPLDLVLIDGGHGFPIPFVDWLYCAPRIREGGIVIVDDTQLWTGAVLRDFLMADPDWRVDTLFERGAAFRKVNSYREKEWNEQPYVLARSSG